MEKTSKKVVIVTTGQPSTNPRVVKDYLALTKQGYDVKVLYSFWADWAIDTDEKIYEQHPLMKENFILVGGSPRANKNLYYLSRLTHKFFQVCQRNFSGMLWKELAVARTAFYLRIACKKYQADLFIGHYVGALPAAVKVAEKQRSKVIFDAEDYHRGEVANGSPVQDIVISIEKKYIPRLNYFTAASPLILQKYQELFPGIEGICVNNVFPKKYLNPNFTPATGGPLKLWWFSQTLGKRRGIEDAIKAIGLLNDPSITLSLLGSCNDETRNFFNTLASENGLEDTQIKYLPPVAEDEIHKVASQHHIGLALEIPESDNRKYCLTNKIFTYLLAGNAIIFSDTPAQRDFLTTYKDCGLLYPSGDYQLLAERLQQYISNPQLLHTHRKNAFNFASTELNWEKEQENLIKLVHKALN